MEVDDHDRLMSPVDLLLPLLPEEMFARSFPSITDGIFGMESKLRIYMFLSLFSKSASEISVSRLTCGIPFQTNRLRNTSGKKKLQCAPGLIVVSQIVGHIYSSV